MGRDPQLTAALAAGELECKRQLRAPSAATRHAAHQQLLSYTHRRAEDAIAALDEERSRINDARTLAAYELGELAAEADELVDTALATKIVGEVAPLVAKMRESGSRSGKVNVAAAIRRFVALGAEQLDRGVGSDVFAAAFAVGMSMRDAIGDARWIRDTDSTSGRAPFARIVKQLADDVGPAKAEQLVLEAEAIVENFCTRARHPSTKRAACLTSTASTKCMVLALDRAARSPEELERLAWEKRNERAKLGNPSNGGSRVGPA